MATKHAGTCPFCKEIVNPITIEENAIRRDKCKCPSCSETIYVCRTPGCDDYAKSGNVYDDELCPECTRSITANSGDLIKGVLVLTASAVATVALGKVLNEDK